MISLMLNIMDTVWFSLYFTLARVCMCVLSTVSSFAFFFSVVPRMVLFFQDFFCSVYPLNIHVRVVYEALFYLVVCWSWLAAALKNQLGASLHNSMFSDDKLVV